MRDALARDNRNVKAGRIEEGKILPGAMISIAMPNRIVVSLERIEEGVRVKLSHAGERKTRVLR